jgi:hypothetical protein
VLMKGELSCKWDARLSFFIMIIPEALYLRIKQNRHEE